MTVKKKKKKTEKREMKQMSNNYMASADETIEVMTIPQFQKSAGCNICVCAPGVSPDTKQQLASSDYDTTLMLGGASREILLSDFFSVFDILENNLLCALLKNL